MGINLVDRIANDGLVLDLPELELSKKAVKMSQCVLHAVCVQVEVSQGLVSGDVANLLQAASEVLSQGSHSYTLYLPVHDDGAGSQTLHRNTYMTHFLEINLRKWCLQLYTTQSRNNTIVNMK